MYLSLFIFVSLFYAGSAKVWTFYEETGFYYQVHRSTEGLNYSEASAHCRSLGAELASIQSKDENDLIYLIARLGQFYGMHFEELTLIEAKWSGNDELEDGIYANWYKDMAKSRYPTANKNCTLMMTAEYDYRTYERIDLQYIFRTGEWIPIQCDKKFKSVICKRSTNPKAVITTEAVETTTVVSDGSTQSTTQNSSTEIQIEKIETEHHLVSGILIDIKDIEMMGLLLIIILLLCCITCLIVMRKATVIVQLAGNDSTDATLSSEKSSAMAQFVSLCEARPKKVKENIPSENGSQKENVYGKGIDDFESGLYNAQYYPGFGDNSSFKVVMDDFE